MIRVSIKTDTWFGLDAISENLFVFLATVIGLYFAAQIGEKQIEIQKEQLKIEKIAYQPIIFPVVFNDVGVLRGNKISVRNSGSGIAMEVHFLEFNSVPIDLPSGSDDVITTSLVMLQSVNEFYLTIVYKDVFEMDYKTIVRIQKNGEKWNVKESNFIRPI